MGSDATAREHARLERVFLRAAQRSSRQLEVLTSVRLGTPKSPSELDAVMIDAQAGITVIMMKTGKPLAPKTYSRTVYQVLQQRRFLHDYLTDFGVRVEDKQVSALLIMSYPEAPQERDPRVPIWTVRDLIHFDRLYRGFVDETAEQPIGVEIAEEVRSTLLDSASGSTAPRRESWRLTAHRALQEGPKSTEELIAAIVTHLGHDQEVPNRWTLQQHLFDSENYALIEDTVPRWEIGSGDGRDQAQLVSPWKVPEYRSSIKAGHLTKLRISGFKTFRDAQELELAPITLIFGENSAGKSSVLQSLLTLVASLRHENGGNPTFRRESGDSSPQAFVNSVYSHNADYSISLGVTHPVAAEPPLVTQVRSPLPPHGYRTYDLEYAMDESGTWVEVRRATIRIGSLAPIRFVRLYDRAGYAQFAPQHLAPGGRAQDDQAFAVENPKALLALLGQCDSGFLPDPTEPLSVALEGGQDVFFNARRSLPGDLLAFHSPDGWRAPESSVWSAIASELARDLMAALTRIRAIGPIRAPLQSVTLSGGSFPSSVGQDGELTAEFLHGNPELQLTVSGWLNRLTGYRLRVASFEDPTPAGDLGDALALVLEDRNGLEVSPSHVGFGVSQILPIAAQCLAPNAGTICIEQPEIHVHPRMQSELADLFIESAMSARNQLIIETHSEHLMLRLQRRIREGILRCEDVRVYYVEQRSDGTGARILELEVDNSGDFLDAWPRGFFAERLAEVLD